MSRDQGTASKTAREMSLSKVRLLALGGIGLLIQGLLTWLILLYVNFPTGYDVLYTLSLESIGLFRALWPYPRMSLAAGTFQSLATLTIVGLYMAYAAALILIRKCSLLATAESTIRVILAFAFSFNIALAVLMPPVLSSDVYNYALYGRMLSLHGLNPYVAVGAAISGDPILTFAYWSNQTARYGPAWTLISAALTAVAGNSVLLTALAFKGAAALLNLANCLLVFLLARRLNGGSGVLPLLLYAWNPLILIETAGSGHNEAVMMTFALLGLLLFVRGRALVGLVALLLSVLLKYLTALLVLFLLVRSLANQDTLRQRVALLGRTGAVTTSVIAVIYLPFWPGAERAGQLLFGLSPSLNSLPNPLRFALRELVGGMLAKLMAVAPPRAELEGYVLWGLNLAFAVFLVIQLVKVATKESDWRRLQVAWGVATLVYLIFVYAGTYPWYLVPPLTIACIGPLTAPTNRRLLLWSNGLGLAAMLVYALPIQV